MIRDYYYILFAFIPYIYIYIYIYISYRPIGIMVSVHQWFDRLGFNPRSSHTKNSKNSFDVSLLNSQHYKVWIKSKQSNPVWRVVPSLTSLWSSYWKKKPSGHPQLGQLSLSLSLSLYIYIYIYIYIYMSYWLFLFKFFTFFIYTFQLHCFIRALPNF